MAKIKEVRIALTLEESKEIRKNGKCDLKRTLSGIPVVFHLEMNESGEVQPVGMDCDLSKSAWSVFVR